MSLSGNNPPFFNISRCLMKKAEERQEEGGGRKLLDTLGFNLIHFVFASIINMFSTLVEGERLLVRYFETLFLEKKKTYCLVL